MDPRQLFFDDLEQSPAGEPITLDLLELRRYLFDQNDWGTVVDILKEKAPSYVRVCNFPDMADTENNREVYNLLGQLLRASPDLIRVHIDMSTLPQLMREEIQNYIVRFSTEEHSPIMPDITCYAGNMHDSRSMNTILFNISNHTGSLDDQYTAWAALGGALSAFDQLDEMRMAYYYAAESAETNFQRAEAYFQRGALYAESAGRYPGYDKDVFYIKALEDLDVSLRYDPKQNFVRQIHREVSENLCSYILGPKYKGLGKEEAYLEALADLYKLSQQFPVNPVFKSVVDEYKLTAENKKFLTSKRQPAFTKQPPAGAVNPKAVKAKDNAGNQRRRAGALFSDSESLRRRKSPDSGPKKRRASSVHKKQ